MTKFYGKIGYGESVESPSQPGVYEDIITEISYYGDLIRNTRQSVEREYVNDDLTVSNSISVVADAYAYEHFHTIRYVRWAGALWKVPEVEVQRPRLILRLGGVYNGPSPS